jgi:hypothetical protein
MESLPVERRKKIKNGFNCTGYKWSSHQGNSTNIPRESPF